MTQPVSGDRLHHVAIEVGDIREAVAWYRERFQCTIEYLDPTWALLGFSNISLALVSPGQHPPHFCVESPDAEKFGTLKPHRDGTRSAYVNDPWGNAVEVLQKEDSS